MSLIDYRNGPSTPWGKADMAYNLTRGVKFYMTPSHGGLGIAPGWAKKNLSPQAYYLAEFSQGKLWYEEDCQCALVFYEHPEFHRDMIQDPEKQKAWDRDEVKGWAEQSIRRYFPAYFDPEFVEACQKAGAIPDSKDLAQGDIIYLFRTGDAYVVKGENRRKLIVEGLQSYSTYAVPKTMLFDALRKVTRGGVWWQRPLPEKIA